MIRRLPIAIKLFKLGADIAKTRGCKLETPVSLNLSKQSMTYICSYQSVLKIYRLQAQEIKFFDLYGGLVEGIAPTLKSKGPQHLEFEHHGGSDFRIASAKVLDRPDLLKVAFSKTKFLMDQLDTIKSEQQRTDSLEKTASLQLRIYFRRFFYVPCDYAFFGSMPKIPNWITAIKRAQQLKCLRETDLPIGEQMQKIRFLFETQPSLVMCHDDLHCGNIVANKSMDDCFIIDYEPVYGLRAFDIAYAAYNLFTLESSSTKTDNPVLIDDVHNFFDAFDKKVAEMAKEIFILFLLLHITVRQICYPVSDKEKKRISLAVTSIQN